MASHWSNELAQALRDTARDFAERVGHESVYAFGLYTSGEGDFSYVVASGNTEEGLARTVEDYHRRTGQDRDELARDLRWSPGDWAYHELPGAVDEVELPRGDDGDVYEGFVAALKKTKRSRVLPKETVYAVVCGDMSLGFLQQGIEALNSKAVAKRWARDYTPERWLAEVRRLPPEARLQRLLGCFEDLYLDRESPHAARARAFGASRFTAQDELRAQGSVAADGLLDLIERHGMGEAFNERGSAAFSAYGAVARPMSLSTSAALMLGRIGPLGDAQVRRMQQLIRRRHDMDRERELAATLSENLARSLHTLLPKRFPPSEMSPSGNHLQSAEAFTDG